jgi:hypothetical protein
MGSHKKVGNFNPKIHKPRPKDHKSLKEMGDFVTERYQQIRDPEIVTDPLAPVLLGGSLFLMKEELIRGAFQWWVKHYCGFTPRTARRYMDRFWTFMAEKHLREEEVEAAQGKG